MVDEKQDQRKRRGGDAVLWVCGEQGGERSADERPGQRVGPQRVVPRRGGNPFELLDAIAETDAPVGDAFHQSIDLPQPAKVVFRGFDALDVDELVEFVLDPERGGEGGWRDEEVAVQAEHACDIGEMALDALAGGAALMQRAAQLHDKAGFHAELGGIHGHNGG